MARTRTDDFRLLLITDHRRGPGDRVEAVVDVACAAGVRAVQLRDKVSGGRGLYELAVRLRRITRNHGAAFFVNDRVDVALAVDADGVHCPEAGFPPGRARALLGPDAIVGASTHSQGSVSRAGAEGASFITFGPVYATPSKVPYGPPQGIDALSRVCATAPVPVFAVGGITPGRAPICLRAGARGVAVITAVMSAPDVVRAVGEFADALGEL